MDDTPLTTPAPTREVLGDLLEVVAETLALVHQAQMDQARCEDALAALIEGDVSDARRRLEELRSFRADRERAFHGTWDGLRALLYRFAGEAPDA
ncbi:MAG: hypothetical protein MUF65_02435 [Rubritepida sp.]|jgi:hypothetical protein|nr:hypothetical protein [Rubritepida sp.]MCU0944209.1 hypothetical protein [Rubritepida sp.]